MHTLIEQMGEDENVVKIVGPNRILFYADISAKSVAILRELLLTLAYGPKPQSLIHLHLFSTGGCAYSGLCGHDIVRTCPIPVYITVEGRVCSAATVLAAGGHRRLMLENASFMIHQIKTIDFSGCMDAMKVDMKNLKSLTTRCVEIYMRITGLTARTLHDLMKDDTEQSAEECLRLCFIHEIVRPCR
jgi:ATP-dependent protease ClpP protease subunit